MFDVGRVCVKTSGREKGNVAVVIDKIDDNFVLIDGGVRRRKCNILHLEPMPQIIDVKKKAATDEVKEALAKAGFEVLKNKKTKKPKEKPVKVRKQHKKTAAEEPVKREEVKKTKTTRKAKEKKA